MFQKLLKIHTARRGRGQGGGTAVAFSSNQTRASRPDSRALRASLTAQPADPNDVLDAGDLAADVDFLHEIMS